MGDLGIRADRGAVLPYREAGRAGEAAGASVGGADQAARPAGQEAASLTLRQLMARISQAERQVQALRQSVQTGEAALAEVQDGLESALALAEESAAGADPDRAALQGELEQLLEDINRILQSGAQPGAFLAGERPEALQSLPTWLLAAMEGNMPDRAELLASLGLDESATSAQLLAALSRVPLEDSPAAGYLAALYLGAVIAGGESAQLDPALAAEGLRQLLELVSKGVPLDEALRELTGGQFTGLEDFQQQFLAATAPGLEAFLSNLLLTGDGQGEMPSVVELLAGGGDMALLMDLLGVLDGSLEGALALPDLPDPSLAAESHAAPQGEAAEAGAGAQPQAMEMGTVQAQGRDLSGVGYDPQSNEATVGGRENVALSGQEGSAPGLKLSGSGTVEVRGAGIPALTVDGSQAKLRLAGGGEIGEIRLEKGAVLTLESDGPVRLGAVRGAAGAVLRIAGGAVEIAGEAPQVPVVMDGPASLIAAQGAKVLNSQGKPLDSFDLMWKLLFPDWQALNALSVDGKQGQLGLARDDLARLWLLKEDASHGYPAYRIALQGRDRAGRLKTQYIYLRWSRQARAFQEVEMYPNPFAVTGGEEDVDWRYEQDSRTLRVLTGQVSAVSGGSGLDANQMPFSGRLALADGVGALELTLDGVLCRVASGRAFSLGGGNRVTLLLGRGTRSFFESGPGCAGISLGEGSSLRIDQAEAAGRSANGTLTAAGGTGSPGIGRDGGIGGQTASILICCQGVTAIEGKPIPQDHPGTALPPVRVSGQALKLDAMDISTQEAAKDAMRMIRAGRRWITKIQESYRTIRNRLEKDLSGLYSVHRHVRVVREADEAGELMWDLRQELLQSPIAAYSQWGMEDVEQLLQVMSGK